MQSQRADSIEFALRALEILAPLDDVGRETASQALVSDVTSHRTGATLGDSGDQNCWVLVQGWACRARRFPDGRRQIFNFIMPGEIVGLRRFDQPMGWYQVVAMTAGATLDAGKIRSHVRLGMQSCTLTDACRRAEDSQAASLFDHITRLGARTAYEATASFFFDLYRRANALDLYMEGRFAMPLSQSALSDCLGVGPVQINRILARLRRERLVSVGVGWVEIPDPAALAFAGRVTH